MSTYLDRLRAQYPSLQDISDDDVLAALPVAQPDQFSGMGLDEVRSLALNDDTAFTRGIKGGVDQLQSLGGGLLALAGDAAGSEKLKNFGLDIYQDNMNEAAINAPTTTFDDLMGSSTDDLGALGADVMEWTGYQLGNLAPTMAASMLGGGVGGFVAKKSAQKAIGSLVVDQLKKGATLDAAKKAAGTALAKRVATGQTLGALAASSGMEIGSIYGETEDVDVSLLHGFAAGAVDALPVGRVLNKFGLASAAKDQIKRSVVGEILKQGVFEGGTEALQTLIEQHASYWVENNGKSLLTDLGAVNWAEIREATAAGALGGGFMSGGTQILTRGKQTMDEANRRIKGAAEDALARGGDALAAELQAARAASQEVPNAANEARGAAQARDTQRQARTVLADDTARKVLEFGGSQADADAARNRILNGVAALPDLPVDMPDPNAAIQMPAPEPTAAQLAARERTQQAIEGEVPLGQDWRQGFDGRAETQAVTMGQNLEAKLEPVASKDQDFGPVSSDPDPELVEVVAKQGVAPEFAVPRVRNLVQKLAEELAPGGGVSYLYDDSGNITGRTESVNPQWFQNAEGTLGSVGYIQQTVKKALTGKKLGAKQQRIIETLVSESLVQDRNLEGYDADRAEMDYGETKAQMEGLGLAEADPAYGEKPASIERPSGEYIDESNVFSLGTIDDAGAVPFMNEMVSNPAYQAREKGRELSIEWMTPDQYVARSAYGSAQKHGGSMDATIAQLRGDKERTGSIAQAMRDGTRFEMPWFDLSRDGFSQEGNHRALAAKELGMEYIPVAVVRDVAPEVAQTKPEYDGKPGKPEVAQADAFAGSDEQADAFGGNEGQEVADAQRAKDAKRSPNTDVPADTDGGLFSNQDKQGTLFEPKAEYVEGLKLATTEAYGVTFETGKPAIFYFRHNTNSATDLMGKPSKGDKFNRGYEPSGRYVVATGDPSITKAEADAGIVTGMIALDNPLVVENENFDWKLRLSNKYDGKTGKALSQAILDAGFDGVVTVDESRGETYPSEILDLTTFDADVAKFSRKGEASDRLSVLHNMSADNLIFADGMGGIAVPSLAIVKADAGMDGFGEITLIGGKSLGDPAQQPTFDADAYTQRFPQPEYKKVRQGFAQELVDKLRPYIKKYTNRGYILDATWDYAVNTPDPKQIINEWMRSNASKAMFVEETQGVKVRTKRQPVPLRTSHSRDPRVVAFFKSLPDDFNHRSYNDDVAVAARKELAGIVRTVLDEQYSDRSGLANRLYEVTVDTETGEVFFAAFSSMQDDQSNIGKSRIDEHSIEKVLDRRIKGKEAQFQAWVNKQVLGMFDDPVITLGRKKVPYNLENIVKVMTVGRVQGAEDTMTFSPGAARAAASTQFDSLEWMRNSAENNLGSKAEVEAGREKADAIMEDYRNQVTDYYKYSDTWTALDNSMKVLADWASSRLRTGDRAAMLSALRKNDFAGVPDAVVDLAMDAGRAMIEAPVPYFEAKPQRAVKLSEFAGAVVPKDASPEVMAILEKNGIEVATYKKAYDEPSRLKAVTRLREKLSDDGKETLFSGGSNANTHTPESLRDAMAGAFGDVAQNLEEGGRLKVISSEDIPRNVQAMYSIAAWHGSPHQFESFSLSAIGSGEGAQAYGHGLYFADSKGVAKSYRDALSSGSDFGRFSRFREKTSEQVKENLLSYLEDLSSYRGLDGADVYADIGDEGLQRFRKGDFDSAIKADAALDGVDAPNINLILDEIGEKYKGSLYRVEIDSDPSKLLDWDSRLSEQPEIVSVLQAYVDKKVAEKNGNLLRTDGYTQTIANIIKDGLDERGWGLYSSLSDYSHSGSIEKNQVAASNVLRDAGIPGIRYLDGSSRNVMLKPAPPSFEQWLQDSKGLDLADIMGTEQEDTLTAEYDAMVALEEDQVSYNYVVFDDELISITDVQLSVDGGIQAYVKNGIVHMVANNIEREANVKGLMMHEIGVHLVRMGKSDAEFQGILTQLARLRDMGSKDAVAAFARVPESTPESLRNEEALGYLVEDAPKTSLAKRAIAWLKAKIQEWLRAVPGMDRARLMKWAKNLTESDMVVMAQAATQRSPAMRATDTNGVQSRKPAYNPDQYTLDLAPLKEADPYVRTDTRPETNPDQREAGRNAVTDLLRLLSNIARRAESGVAEMGAGQPVSVLGLRIAKRFTEGKPNQLVGAKVAGNADLAAVAQVYRDPRFETFRIVMVKDGRVVGERAITSRLPAAATFGDTDAMIADIKDSMAASGADGYYIMHNHPSGKSNPSAADISATKHIAEAAPGFIDHVIIDFNEYTVIDKTLGTNTIKDDSLKAIDFYAEPGVDNEFLGIAMNNTEIAANVAKGVAQDDRVVIMTTTGGVESKIQTISAVPLPVLNLAANGTKADKKRLLEAVLLMNRKTGSGGFGFIVLPKDFDGKLTDYAFLLEGYAVDVLTADGKSLRDVGRGLPPVSMLPTGTARSYWTGADGKTRMVGANTGGGVAMIDAWHGSPYVFDEFDSSNMGRGEGAQAFGAGTYFAGRKGVATSYRESLAKERIEYQGKPLSELGNNSFAFALNYMTGGMEFSGLTFEETRDEQIIKLGKQIDQNEYDLSDLTPDEIARGIDKDIREQRDERREAIELLRQAQEGDLGVAKDGALYRVALNVEPDQLLDWDTPLVEQKQITDKLTDSLKLRINGAISGFGESKVLGKHLVEAFAVDEFGSNRKAAEGLRKLGIPGIKYLDGISRNKPIKDVKKSFTSVMPDDASFEEVADYLQDGMTFTDDQAKFLWALEADDWLGFDYPAQAISAALGNELSNYDPSPELLAAVKKLRGDSTYNYVVFDDGLIKVVERNGELFKTDEQVTEPGAAYGPGAISPQLKQWFGDSKVTDENGDPLVVYRGEHGKGGGQFESRLGSISFGSKDAANTYAMSPNNSKDTAVLPRVTPVYLSIQNPLLSDSSDPFIDMSLLADALGKEKMLEFASKHSVYLEETNNWDENYSDKFASIDEMIAKAPDLVSQQYGVAYPFLDDASLVEALKKEGYDGAILGGVGENEGEAEYRIFDESQAKSAVGNNGDFDASNTSIVAEPGAAYGSDPSFEARKAKADAQGFDTSQVWYHANTGGIVGAGFDNDRLPGSDPDAPFNAHWFSHEPSVTAAYRGGRDGNTITPVYIRGKAAPYAVVMQEMKKIRDSYLSDDIPTAEADANLDRIYKEGGASHALRKRLVSMGYTHSIWRGREPINAAELERTGQTTFKDSRGGRHTLKWDTIKVRGEEIKTLDLYDGGEHITGYSDLKDFEQASPEREAVAVFDPSAIRSIYAKFDDDQFGVNNLVGEDTPSYGTTADVEADPEIPGEGFNDKLTRMDKLKLLFVDRFHALVKTQKQMGDDSADPMTAITLFPGATRARLDDFENDFVIQLADLIDDTNLTFAEVAKYLHARHAEEANAVLRERNPDRQDNDALSGMSDADAQATMALYQGNERLEAVGELVDRINRGHIDQMVKDELLTQEEADAWTANYEHYVPLQREDVAGNLGGRGRGFDVRGRESKLRAGSNKAVDYKNMIAHMIAQVQTGIVRGEKNKVAQELYAMIEANPNSDLWSITELPQNPYMKADGTIGYQTNMQDQMVMSVKFNGEQKYVWFNPESETATRVATAMKNLNNGQQNAITSGLLSLNRYLSTINTSLSPEFVISNFFRDLQTAVYNLTDTEIRDMERQVVMGVPQSMAAIRASLRGDGDHPLSEIFEEFRRMGGMTGWTQHYSDIESQMKAIERGLTWRTKPGLKEIESVGKFIGDYNTIVENGVRLSTYITARNAGMSKLKAARMAKEITVDFNRKGEWGTAMNAMYLFYNASIQGSARILRAALDPKNKRLRKMLLATVAFAAVNDLLNRGLAPPDDEDESSPYDLIDDSVKDRNLIIWDVTGMTERGYFKIPLPWGYNVFHIIGQEIGKAISAGTGSLNGYSGADSAFRLGGAILNSFNPMQDGSLLQTLSPTVVDPVVRIAENKDWHGGRLYPDYNDAAPNYTKYFKNARQSSKEIAGWLGELTQNPETLKSSVDVSPEWIDMLFDFATGSVGRFAADTAEGVATLMSDRPLPELNDIPMARKVIGEVGEGAERGEFYDKFYEIEDIRTELSRIKTDDPAMYREKMDGIGRRKYLIGYTKATKSQLNKLKKAKREAERRGNQKAADQFDARMLQIMQRYTRQYNKVMYRQAEEG